MVWNNDSYIGWIFLSEFLGSMLLILLGNGVVALANLKTSKGKGVNWNAIALGWGMSVFVGAIVSQYSGAQLNFAVSLGLMVESFKGDTFNVFSDGHQWLVFIYLIAQFAGMFVAQVALDVVYWLQIEKSDAGDIFAMHSTSPAQSERSAKTYSINVFTEFVGTFVLVLGVSAAMFYSGALKNTGTFSAAGLAGPAVAAVIVGAIGYGLGGPTGFAINPTRDLAPRLVHQIMPLPNKGSSDWAYSWVPIVAPILGALAAGGVAYGIIG